MNSTTKQQNKPVESRDQSAIRELWVLLDQVTDPEIPVISIRELGILQDITQSGDEITVTITPTYSGCPAMVEISKQIEAVLTSAGHHNVDVKSRLAPAWSTDWISDEGKSKLQQYGIAPPLARNQQQVCCPQCGSDQTALISEFGSTACKALYKCKQCLEPFDYFKCI